MHHTGAAKAAAGKAGSTRAGVEQSDRHGKAAVTETGRMLVVATDLIQEPHLTQTEVKLTTLVACYGSGGAGVARGLVGSGALNR